MQTIVAFYCVQQLCWYWQVCERCTQEKCIVLCSFNSHKFLARAINVFLFLSNNWIYWKWPYSYHTTTIFGWLCLMKFYTRFNQTHRGAYSQQVSISLQKQNTVKKALRASDLYDCCHLCVCLYLDYICTQSILLRDWV